MKNGDFTEKNEYSIGLSWGYVFLQVFPEANSGRVGSSSCGKLHLHGPKKEAS
jgi:hypothetical protein